MRALVTNIQPFCLHDGPGIRTTVFLKGCNLHCPWCSNPENLLPQIEFTRKGLREIIYGQYMSKNELENELIKDIAFYGEDGGITWSGGEPLLQFPVIEPVLQRMQQLRIHQTVETALFVSHEQLEIALRYLDMFFIDIKILDEKQCKENLGGDIWIYRRNVQEVFQKKKRVIFRIPLIKGYTVSEENLNLIIEFLQENRPEKVELIKGHNMSEEKYKLFGKPFFRVPEISDHELESICSQISKLGIRTEICKI